MRFTITALALALAIGLSACSKKGTVVALAKKPVTPKGTTGGNNNGGSNTGTGTNNGGDTGSGGSYEPHRVLVGSVTLLGDLSQRLLEDTGAFLAEQNCFQVVIHDDLATAVEMGRGACPESGVMDWSNVIVAFGFRPSENGATQLLYHPDYPDLDLGFFVEQRSEWPYEYQIQQLCTADYKLDEDAGTGCKLEADDGGVLYGISVSQ